MSAALPASEIIIPPKKYEARNRKDSSCGSDLFCQLITSLATGSNEICEQAFRRRIAEHPLRMPLNANHPVSVASPLDSFHGTVIGTRGDSQVPTRRGHRLMMRAVNFTAAAARDCAQAAALLKRRRVARIVFRFRREVFFPVWDGGARLCPQVLYQGAAQIDVQELATVADGQNRLLFGESMFQDGSISGFTSQIRWRRQALVYSVIFRRLDVSRTAGQDKGIQGRKRAVKLDWVRQG
jgi:hypothetical protein